MSPVGHRVSPECHQNVTKMSPKCHEMSPNVTRCQEVSRKCHGVSRSVTKCHRGFSMSQNVSELSPNVTKVSPKCHGMSRMSQNVTKCHNRSPKCHRYVTICHDMSPICHHLSPQITERHKHCLCDIYLLGWGVAGRVLAPQGRVLRARWPPPRASGKQASGGG